MNFLFHMLLSGNDDQVLVGNFMGDFVKGPLGDAYPPRVRQGLILHRKIDSFAQQDTNFQTSRSRLAPHYGLYRGVLVDLFYDHFLAIDWDRWSDTPLPAYLATARAAINSHLHIMPAQLQGFVPVIFSELLPSYAGTAGIASALLRMSRRIRRPNPLAGGEAELTTHYEALKADFEQFIIRAQGYTSQFMATGGGI